MRAQKDFHSRFSTAKLISVVLATCSIAFSISAHGDTQQGFDNSFVVFDEMRFKEKPDLTRMGFVDIRVIYAAEMWPRGAFSDEINEGYMHKFFSRSEFKRAPIVCIDIEHWPLDPRTNDRATVDLSIARYRRVIDIFKQHNPHTPVGFYGMLPIRDYFAPVRGRNKDAWQQANRDLAVIADSVDVIFPSIYTFYKKEAEWEVYAMGNIEEAKQYGKPVIPFIWPQYHGSNKRRKGQYIDKAFWRKQLDTVHEHADGVVIWTRATNAPYWDWNASWWRSTQSFMRSVK